MVWQANVDRDQIHPDLVLVMDHALARLEANNTPFKVISGLRTFAEQNVLYAQGRTQAGNIVTKARGGQSMHNYGLAVDGAPLADPTNPQGNLAWPELTEAAGEIWYTLEKAVTEAAAELQISNDVEWGGRWAFRDLPHVQIRTTLKELEAGHYPSCDDVEWLVTAHTTFLFDTDWIRRRTQFLLNALGYDCGPVDGDIGPRTQATLHAFQDKYDLRPENPPLHSDVIDQETVEKLVRLFQDV